MGSSEKLWEGQIVRCGTLSPETMPMSSFYKDSVTDYPGNRQCCCPQTWARTEQLSPPPLYPWEVAALFCHKGLCRVSRFWDKVQLTSKWLAKLYHRIPGAQESRNMTSCTVRGGLRLVLKLTKYGGQLKKKGSWHAGRMSNDKGPNDNNLHQ